MTEGRDPSTVNCWLVGGGMGCLAAAVHLIHEAKVPASNIHILELDGTQISTHGDPDNGYTIHAGLQPCFNEPCVKSLLSLVPRPSHEGQTLFDVIEDDAKERKSHPDAWTRVLVSGESGPVRLDSKKWGMRFKDRLDLTRVMLESEENLGDKSVRQVFDHEFFESNFWVLWSTTFALQPWHSASEFRRHLHKYLQDIKHLNNAPIFGHVQYTFQDSILLPIRNHLQSEGVDFIQYIEIDLQFTRSDDNMRISSICLQSANWEERSMVITLDPNDIAIAYIGPTKSTAVLGTHITPPAHSPILTEAQINQGAWSLWNDLSKKDPRFGNPRNFYGRLSETRLVTFTITLRNPLFIDLYTTLTKNEPGAGAFVTLAKSSWLLTLNVPSQPVFPSQPPTTEVIWGYGLAPDREGDYIHKTMPSCTGEEIMTELLSHLQFPREPILSTTTVIPCVMPYATSSMVTRAPGDRPTVIPDKTTNFATVGQFTEIPADTTFSMDYTVRSAQMAVYGLMGLGREPPRPKKGHFMEVFDFLT